MDRSWCRCVEDDAEESEVCAGSYTVFSEQGNGEGQGGSCCKYASKEL